MHLKKVFVNNDYPEAFLSATLNPVAPKPREDNSNGEEIPYAKGLSEDIRRACRKFDIKVAFRSGVSLRSKLSKVKDKLPNSNVVYRVPCSCGKFYIGGMVRRLETRLKEHKEACLRGEQEKSDHAWSSHHPILWKEASVVDQARTRKELLLKEALHISLTSEEQRFNRDVGLELQGCWVSTLKALRK